MKYGKHADWPGYISVDDNGIVYDRNGYVIGAINQDSVAELPHDEGEKRLELEPLIEEREI